MNISEVNLEFKAQHRIVFHNLRLCAALRAFQGDAWMGRQQWWLQNLKFELVNLCNHPSSDYSLYVLVEQRSNVYWTLHYARLECVGSQVDSHGWSATVEQED